MLVKNQHFWQPDPKDVTPVSNPYDQWVLHFHIGNKGVPLTMYKTGDSLHGSVYEVKFGAESYTNLLMDEASLIVGRLIVASALLGKALSL